MSRLEPNDIMSSLEGLLKRMESGEYESKAHERDALKQVIEQDATKARPMSAYFALEDWLYNDGKEKDLETKSALIWGGLFVVEKMGCIDWDDMRRMYGEFMSKQMKLR